MTPSARSAEPAAAPGSVDLPVISGPTLDENSSKLSLEDPLFLTPLQDPDNEPGFSLGDTSLPEPLMGDTEEGAESRLPVAPVNSSDRRRSENSNPELVPEEADRRVLLNAAIVSPRTITQRTALHQALSTGESILGNLSGLRGVLNSPFQPTRRLELQPAFRIGPVDVRPHVSAGFVVGHSSQDSEGGDDTEVGGFLQSGVLAVLRKTGQLSGALDYTIGTTFSNTQDNQTEQLLSVSSDFTFPQMSKVHFGLGLDYASLSSVSRDAGGVEKRTLVTPALTVSYAYSRKTSFDWDITVPIRDVSDGTSSLGVTNTLFVNNQITRKTQVGLGFALGSLTVDESSRGRLGGPANSQGSVTQWFQQLLLRARYQPSALFSFDGTIGLELREIGDSADLSPIFGFGAIWKPRRETEVTLVAERRTFNAGTALNTNFTSTTIRLSVSQRLAYRLTGSLSLAYDHATYESDGDSIQNDRIDDLVNASAGLTLAVTNRWSWSFTLSAGKNKSNVAPFDYIQGVLETSYDF